MTSLTGPADLTGPGDFTEVADAVFVLAYPVLTVNSTLIVGDRLAAVVDTLSTADQAGELLAAVRRITDRPLLVVNTHHHFDHCLGNDLVARDGPGEVWGHEATARALRERAAAHRRSWYAECLAHCPELADAVAATTIRPPDRTVHTASTVDLGGRLLELRHFGPAHTDADLVVHVPDADVLVAGDLVESAGPPAFEDAFPVHWPEALAALVALVPATATVVPGHGPPVDVDFVRAQHDELTELAWLIREGHGDGATEESVAGSAPFDRVTSLVAVRRGYAELSGRA